MIQYSFSLIIYGTNERYRYQLELTPREEDYPEEAFTPSRCQQIQEELEKKSACRIDENSLSRIVKTWIKDIREGYRDSSIILELPSLLESQIMDLQDDGNQEIPALFPPDLSEIEPKHGALPPLIFN